MLNIDELEILKALLFDIQPGQILNWYRLEALEKNERFFRYSFKDVNLYAYRDSDENKICFFYMSSMQRLKTVHLYFTLSDNLYPSAIDLETIKNDTSFENFYSITQSVSFQEFSEEVIALKRLEENQIALFEKNNFKIEHLLHKPFTNKLFFDVKTNSLQIPFFENKRLINVLKHNKSLSQLQLSSTVGIWSAEINTQNIHLAIFNNVESLSSYFLDVTDEKDFAVMLNYDYAEQNIIQIFSRFVSLRYKKIVVPCFTVMDEVFALKIAISFINSYMSSFRKYKLQPLGENLFELQVRSNVDDIIKEDSRFFVDMITLTFIEPEYKCLTFETIQTPIYKIMHFRFSPKKELLQHFIETIIKEENVADIFSIDLKF